MQLVADFNDPNDAKSQVVNNEEVSLLVQRGFDEARNILKQRFLSIIDEASIQISIGKGGHKPVVVTEDYAQQVWDVMLAEAEYESSLEFPVQQNEVGLDEHSYERERAELAHLLFLISEAENKYRMTLMDIRTFSLSDAKELARQEATIEDRLKNEEASVRLRYDDCDGLDYEQELLRIVDTIAGRIRKSLPDHPDTFQHFEGYTLDEVVYKLCTRCFRECHLTAINKYPDPKDKALVMKEECIQMELLLLFPESRLIRQHLIESAPPTPHMNARAQAAHPSKEGDLEVLFEERPPDYRALPQAWKKPVQSLN